MGSSYFGFPKMGNSNEKSSSSSSSRKSKKSSSDKPKQPQRGLGVAQLEQIRLRGQMGCSGFTSSSVPNFHQDDMRAQGVPSYGVQQSSSYNNPYYSQSSSPSTSSPYAHHPNFLMVFGDHERSNLRYQDSQPSTTPRWNPNGVLESSTYNQSDSSSRHLISYFEDSRHQRMDFLRSNQTSEPNEHEDVDLELRLSL